MNLSVVVGLLFLTVVAMSAAASPAASPAAAPAASSDQLAKHSRINAHSRFAKKAIQDLPVVETKQNKIFRQEEMASSSPASNTGSSGGLAIGYFYSGPNCTGDINSAEAAPLGVCMLNYNFLLRPISSVMFTCDSKNAYETYYHDLNCKNYSSQIVYSFECVGLPSSSVYSSSNGVCSSASSIPLSAGSYVYET